MRHPPANRPEQADAPAPAIVDAARRLLHAAEQVRAEAEEHQRALVQTEQHTQGLIRELHLLLGENAARSTRAASGVDHLGDEVVAGVIEPAAMPPERAQAAWVAGGRQVGAAANEPTDPSTPPALQVYLLGHFRVGTPAGSIEEWPQGKSRSLFKYLVLHRGTPVPREVLMDVFWRGADPDAARNSLNVAMHGLRRALAQADPNFAFVVFRHGCYALHPALRLWVDAEAFVEHADAGDAAERRGETAAAAAAHRLALAIYQAPLLVEDRYEDWSAAHRQGLQDRCGELLNRLRRRAETRGDLPTCIAAATRMLEIEPCDEDAHRQLMRCYSRLGQAHLALRQYHACVDALARELKLIPSPQTVALFQQIRQRLSV